MTVLTMAFIAHVLAVSVTVCMLAVSVTVCMLAVSVTVCVLTMSFIAHVLAVSVTVCMLSMSFIAHVLAMVLLACVTICGVGCVSVVVFAHTIACLVVAVVVWVVDAGCHFRAGDTDRAGDCKQYNQREPDSDECSCHFDLLSYPYSRLGNMGMGVNTASKMP